MTLRARVFSIIVLLTVVAIVVVYGVANTILIDSFEELDRDSAARNIERAQKALEDDLANLNTGNLDWSVWDDSYQFVADRNQQYIDANLVDSVFDNLGLDLIIYTDTGHRMVIGLMSIDGRGQAIPESFLKEINLSASPLLLSDDGVQGVVMVSGEHFLIVSNPILQTDGQGPPRGSLVWARRITEAYIQTLAERTLLDIDLHEVAAASDEALNRAREALAQNESSIQNLNDETIGAYAAIDDIEGRPTLIMQVTLTRDHLAQGQVTVDFIFVVLGAAMLALGVAFFAAWGGSLSLLWQRSAAPSPRLTQETARAGAWRLPGPTKSPPSARRSMSRWTGSRLPRKPKSNLPKSGA